MYLYIEVAVREPTTSTWYVKTQIISIFVLVMYYIEQLCDSKAFALTWYRA